MAAIRTITLAAALFAGLAQQASSAAADDAARPANPFGGLSAPVPATVREPTGRHPAAPGPKATTADEIELVPFENSPFPYDGAVPDGNKPFFDIVSGGRRGHTSPRGGLYWENATYRDNRTLLFIPKGFDPSRPALLIVYFHGNLATLEKDVRVRQHVPRQVAQSGLNAVLVAPQFAVNALDSSAGRFWEPGVFRQFLNEASERLARLYGDESARPVFAAVPVVLVAYSGGYMPAAWSLAVGGAGDRLDGGGVVLLDALYGEEAKVADWIASAHTSSFFFSAYSNSSRDQNAALQRTLGERGIDVAKTSTGSLVKGTVGFQSAGNVPHEDFVSHAWVNDPLKAVLARISGFSKAQPRNARTGVQGQAER
jgi:hypothetical protein